jgi:hypothetical protein
MPVLDEAHPAVNAAPQAAPEVELEAAMGSDLAVPLYLRLHTNTSSITHIDKRYRPTLKRKLTFS